MGKSGEVWGSGYQWYAVWTRSRQEKTAAAMLDAFGIEQYLPMNIELRRWSDRKQMVEVPIFSGYLFVYMDLLRQSKLRVLNVPGIVDFVHNHMGPLPIPDREIEDIRTMLRAGVQCSSHSFIGEGERVRVVRGVLAGLEGQLVRNASRDRLIIAVETIQRSLAVDISRQDVEPAIPTSPAARLPKLSIGYSPLST